MVASHLQVTLLPDNFAASARKSIDVLMDIFILEANDYVVICLNFLIVFR